MRRLARCVVALSALALGACGDDPAPQLEVVSREVAWTSTATTLSHEPLSTTWLVGESVRENAWRRESRADGSIVLTGPHGVSVQPDVHHALMLMAQASGPAEVTVSWRDRGQSFSPERRVGGFSVAPSESISSYLIPFADLRGVGDASDAEDGVELFEIRITARDGGAAPVRMSSVGLASEYDRQLVDAPEAMRLRARGVTRVGLAARVPSRVQARMDLARGDSVRFGLALAGTDTPLDLTVRIGSEIRVIHCTPGTGWTEVSMDVPPGSVESIVFDAEAAPDRNAVLLIGGLLHLRPAERVLPDVILYVEDTLRADRLGTYGYARPTDPHLQAIARQGAVFERAFATSNWTRPSSSSLMTSLVPSAHGNQTHRRRIPRGLDTLAETLADEGYATLSFVSNYHAGEWSGLEQGFDVHAEPAAFGLPLAPDTLTSSRIHAPLTEALAAYEGVRLFVLVHSLDPHAPYEPPPEAVAALHDDRLDLEPSGDETTWSADSRNYDAEIRHNDGWLARLDEDLAARGRTDDTLLIFTSDHGEGFGEHGHTDHHKTLYQEELAIPLVVRWPAAIPGGRRLDEPVSLIDVAPTIIGLLGLAAPDAWQGHDVSARLTSPDLPEDPPRPILIETIAAPDKPNPGRRLAVVLHPHKLIVRVEDDRVVPEELFDLAADPSERTDLLGDRARSHLVARLAAVAQQAVDDGPLITHEETLVPMGPALRDWMAEMGYLR
ncbi:MAG: sulfatase [Planctomycetota bacterium]|jgi:arylsulfatase A-like enzyme